MKAQYEAHVAALHEKLEWYANNQRLLTENDELLARQADTISELKKRLEAQPKNKASAQKIADLNKQVLASHVRAFPAGVLEWQL